MGPLGFLADGTAYFAALGELTVDEAAGLVRCHACGAWFRQLHHAHLRTHGMTASAYRARYGLRAGHPLQAPDLLEMRRIGMRQQVLSDPRIRRALEEAQARTRSGEMIERARRANTGVARRLETRLQIRQTLVAARLERQRAARARREERARALGFGDVPELLRRRYQRDGWTIDRIARVLGCRASTVRDELVRAGIPREDARARAARSRVERNRQVRVARARQLGFETPELYVADRRDKGWTQQRIAAELGVGEKTVRSLLQQ